MKLLSNVVGMATLLFASADVVSAQFQDAAAPSRPHSVTEYPDGSVVAADETGTYVYTDWSQYFRSGFFMRHGKRCGAGSLALPPSIAFLGSQNDCTNTSNNPAPEYDPTSGTSVVYDIPVVFHIFYANNGNGNIADDRVTEQIQILNDDFASLTNSKIQFHLATEDPNGNPTTGIQRFRNNRWYNDSGNYAPQVSWDTNRYLNIYSNTAGGNLGYAYVPNGGGVVGSTFDGVRLFWQSIGYTSYAPYNLGRTGTHEVGHYLGLLHTFDGGCGTSNCNTSGDLICDTNPESSPNYSSCFPSQRVTCGNQDPVRNYMDYSEDACMDNFSFGQALRMRCTLDNWRVNLANWDGGGGGNNNPPTQAAGESPVSGSGSVSTGVNLSWDAASGATLYDVYFGTSTNPPLASSDQTGTSYSPGTLANGTTYYWRVDSQNDNGVTGGALWSFTTEAGGTGGGDLPFSDGFESASLAGWNTSGNVRVSSTSNSGAYAAELRRNASMSRTLDTGGATEVTLGWSWRSNALDYPADEATLTITHAGGTISVDSLSSNSSYASSIQQITGLTGSTITVTFTCSANRNNERLYVDDVSVQ